LCLPYWKSRGTTWVVRRTCASVGDMYVYIYIYMFYLFVSRSPCEEQVRVVVVRRPVCDVVPGRLCRKTRLTVCPRPGGDRSSRRIFRPPFLAFTFRHDQIHRHSSSADRFIRKIVFQVLTANDDTRFAPMTSFRNFSAFSSDRISSDRFFASTARTTSTLYF